MTCDVGAVAIVYQKQVQSSIEMIKSFRQNNQSSTIVLCTDGLVDEIDITQQKCKIEFEYDPNM